MLDTCGTPVTPGHQQHSVKDTTDVRRKKASLPSVQPHPKPVAGSWLSSRHIVNNYILLESLGTGSYGEVRLCKERTTDKLFAIKIITKDMLKKKKVGQDSSHLDDVKREIAIMKKLSHPNVLRLYEVMDDPNVNKLYLVLEYMKLGDLMHVLKVSKAQLVLCCLTHHHRIEKGSVNRVRMSGGLQGHHMKVVSLQQVLIPLANQMHCLSTRQCTKSASG
jgi:hypothetical protein